MRSLQQKSFQKAALHEIEDKYYRATLSVSVPRKCVNLKESLKKN